MGITLFVISTLVGYCLLKQSLISDRPVVLFSGAIVVGCLLCGSILYLLDLFFVWAFADYFNATLLFLVAAGAYIFYCHKKQKLLELLRNDASALMKDRFAILCAAVFLVFSAWLNWHSLNVTSNGNVLVANGAWSDLMYHLAYVRSVAVGNNVPLQYPYFANEPVRYHFMFDYFTGKISQLGLDSVQALNLMSTAGLLSLLLLVLEFGRTLFRSNSAGLLGALLLLFHSSLSVFPWIKNHFRENLVQKLLSQSEWLVGAPFEVWGLLNLNVFINQRHFAFGLALLVLLVISLIKLSEAPQSVGPLDRYRKFSLFWVAVVSSLPFWNALFAAIAIGFLFAFAVLNYRTREVFIPLIITAAVASILVYPQLMLFKSGDSALGGYPKWHFGFALDSPSLPPFVVYYCRVFGFKLLLIVAALILIARKSRLYFLVLLLPFVLANALQFSSVLYDNNKLIIASVVFVNCYAGYAITRLFKTRRKVMMLLAIAFTVSVTSAGFVDFFAVKNLKHTEIEDTGSALKSWVVYQTEPKSVFLTNVFIPFADNAISSVTLGGRYLYVVSNCVASSCFVDGRIEIARQVYSFEGGAERVRSTLQREKIDYVLIDEHVRQNKQLGLNEKAFIENFRQAYKDEQVSIFACGR